MVSCPIRYWNSDANYDYIAYITIFPKKCSFFPELCQSFIAQKRSTSYNFRPLAGCNFIRSKIKVIVTMSNIACAGIEELVRNAELRTELEPYADESVGLVRFVHQSLLYENEFLAGMLDWEISPAEPIYKWFTPELSLPAPGRLNDEQLLQVLENVVEKLFEKKLILDFADHLSDRELYTLIYRDILPSREKNLQSRNGFIHWDCSCGDDEIWLRYYASDDEREQYQECTGELLPPKEVPPHYRSLPQCAF